MHHIVADCTWQYWSAAVPVVPAAVRKEPVLYCAVLSPVMRFIKVAKGSKVVVPLRAISQLHAVGQHHQPAWLEHPAVQHRSPHPQALDAPVFRQKHTSAVLEAVAMPMTD